MLVSLTKVLQLPAAAAAAAAARRRRLTNSSLCIDLPPAKSSALPCVWLSL
jgi:hypothetical protein